ncbi:hypothetical protein B6D52_03335, partial [Candidatus Parcubacteria bacterium 4484_255]
MGRKSRQKRERTQSHIKKEVAEGGRDQAPQSFQEMLLLFIIYGATYLLLFIPTIVGTRYFFPYVGPKGLYLMGLVEVMFCAWLVLAYLNPKYRPKSNVVLWSLGAYVIILVLATFLGVDPLRSFWSKFERMSGTLIWLHLFAFFIVSISVFNKKQWQRFFLASLGAALFVCLAFFAGGNTPLTSKGGSTLGNSSFLATYLLFNIYFALYLAVIFYEQIKEKRQLGEEIILDLVKIGSVISVLVFMFIVLAQSKGAAAFVSCVAGFGLILLFWIAFQVKNSVLRKLGKIALVLGIIGYILAVFLLLTPNSFLQNYYLNFRSRARPVVWQIAWKGFLDKPVLGWGPQNFIFVFEKYFDPWLKANNKPRFDQAHNIVMDSLVDCGILGFLAYLAFFGSVFWVLWRRAASSRVSFFAAAIFTSLLVAHFTQNLTVFDMPASYFMLFLVLGFAGTLGQSKVGNQKLITSRPSPWIIILSVLIFAFSFTYFVYKPSIAAQATVKSFVAQTYNQRMEFCNEALHTSPLGLYQIRYHLASNLLRNAGQKEVRPQEFELMIKEAEKSIATSPMDYDSYLSLANLYDTEAILFGQANLLRAQEVLKQAIVLAPTKQDGYWEMAKNQSILGNEDAAISYAKEAVDIDPSLP